MTTAFWQAHPQAFAAATRNPEPAAEVMARFTAWSEASQAEAIFAAHPVTLGTPWIDHHPKRFTGRPLFEGPWIADSLFRHRRSASCRWWRARRGAALRMRYRPLSAASGWATCRTRTAQSTTRAAMPSCISSLTRREPAAASGRFLS